MNNDQTELTGNESIAGLWIDHLKAARIPLLIIVAGAALTFGVDQIGELFFLLANTAPLYQEVAAVLMALLLGVVVWHTTRTIYRFDLPGLPALQDSRGDGIRKWLPRALGAAVPMLMMVGYIAALRLPSIKRSDAPVAIAMPIIFLAEAVALFVFVANRRTIQRKFASTVPADPRDDPRVTRWSQLAKSARRLYLLMMLANIAALVAAVFIPGHLAAFGTLSVILLVAAFATTTGTYLTIQAYRWRFPLLTSLLLLAILWQWAGSNDNHRIRLYPSMNVDSSPDWTRVDMRPPLGKSFEDYARQWLAGRPVGSPIYLVSAEGGGIRAAAWTTLVLTQLELASGGEFHKSMLAGSGVSGGSLGLALFDAMLKANSAGILRPQDYSRVVDSYLETDFLAATIETMFLPDASQRFIPGAWFIDRGQRLEMALERAWLQSAGCKADAPGGAPQQNVAPACDIFSGPWSQLWAGESAIPILFFNSTIVQTGQRFVQYPFASMASDRNLPDLVVFHGSQSSPGMLPASAPLSAVVHNSARFSYVSPAGTLMFAPESHRQSLQLVDGGYFENSGTTTLAEIAQLLMTIEPSCAPAAGGLAADGCRIRIIHISNDPQVAPLLGGDTCDKPATDVRKYGEAVAPVIALSNTRDARGEYARRSLSQATLPAASINLPRHFAHLRLCIGTHPLPLGWTMSAQSMLEMRNQMCNQQSNTPNAPFNKAQLDQIAAGGAASAPPAGLCAAQD
jgi:hypothetical protein